MKRYLLDTSICVFLFRNNREVAQRLNKIGLIEGLDIEDWIK